LQNYFTKVLEDNLKALIKPQYVDHIPRAIKGPLTVSQMLDSKLERDNKQLMCEELELIQVLDREVSQLSGGELQRFAIAMSCIQKADVFVYISNTIIVVLIGDHAVTCLTNHRVISISSRDSRPPKSSDRSSVQIGIS
jgi:translation initiation factor RLI1